MIQFDTEPAAAHTHAMFKGNRQRSAKQAPRLFRAMQAVRRRPAAPHAAHAMPQGAKP